MKFNADGVFGLFGPDFEEDAPGWIGIWNVSTPPLTRTAVLADLHIPVTTL